MGTSMAALGVDVQMQGRGPSWFPGELISPVLRHFVLVRKGTPWALPQGSCRLETGKAPQVSLMSSTEKPALGQHLLNLQSLLT